MGAHWSEAELALLKDTALSLAEVAERTGRTVPSVRSKASNLQIKRDALPWSAAELAILADKSLSYAEVAARTGRSVATVKSRASLTGVTRHTLAQTWPDWELKLLRDTSLPLAEVVERTGRTWASVQLKASRLGIQRRDKKRAPWADWELALLRDTTLPLATVAERTGRSLHGVENKAFRLGVARKHTFWSEDDYDSGAVDYRGPDWLEVRTGVLRRDGYTCQDGGEYIPSGRGLVVHHVIPYRLRPVNDLAWLVTLCKSHHMRRPEHQWTEIPEVVALQLRVTDQRGDEN